MLEKIILNSLLDDTFKKKIEKLSKDCLRTNSEKVKCQKCHDICPEKAVEIYRAGVKVDSLACTGCNLCVSHCYSRTLSSPNRPYLASMNKIVESKESTWGCMKTKDTCDISFGCLRTIDPRFLMGLAFADLDHKVNLNLSKCEECKYKDLGWDINYLLEYITDHGQIENFAIVSNSTYDKDQTQTLSRRDFLKGFLTNTQSISKTAIKETSKELGLDLETEENLDIIIKILLKKGISNNNNADFMKDYIFELKVDDKCTFCYECVSYCPTKALSIESTKEEKKLLIDLSLCNYCNRCLEKCGEEAISKGSFETMTKKLLYQERKYYCKACKVLTTELNEEGLCLTCEIRRKNRKPRRI